MGKKRITIIVLSTLMNIFATEKTIETTVEWQCIGPKGGDFYIFAECNERIFIGGHKWLYQSDDQGKIWSKNHKIPPPINALSIKGDTIFAVSGHRSIIPGHSDSILWRSTDNGNTWKNIFKHPWPNDEDFVPPLVFDGIKGIMFFRVAGVFYRSTDGGENWDALNISSEVEPFNPKAMAHFGDTIIAGGNTGNPRFTTRASIYRSTDLGISWDISDNGIVGTNVNDLTVKNDLLFAGTDDGLFISSDHGANWEKINNEMDHIYKLEKVEDYLLCGRGNGLYYSEDNGQSWERITIDSAFNDTSSAFDYYCNVKNIFVTRNREIFISVSNMGYLYKSNGDLDEWNQYGKESNSRTIIDLYPYNNYVYAIDPWGQIYEITHNEKVTDWKTTGRIPGAIGLYRSERYFLSGMFNGVYRSLDNGNSWKDFNKGGISSRAYSFSEINGSLFLATWGTTYRLSDEESQWTPSGERHAHPIIANKGRLFSGWPVLSVSDDHGSTWENKSMSADSVFSTLAAHDNMVVAAQPDGDIYISLDNGNKWEWKTCPKGIYTKIASPNKLLVAMATMIFAATKDSGVYVSFDTARSWIQINKGLGINNFYGKKGVKSLVIQENRYLYAATENAVYMLDVMTIDSSSVDIHSTSPQAKSPLIRVVPNNRSYSTVIVNSNQPGITKLALFDLQGRCLFTGRYRNDRTKPLNISIPVKSAGLHILEIVTPDGNRRVPVVGYR